MSHGIFFDDKSYKYWSLVIPVKTPGPTVVMPFESRSLAMKNKLHIAQNQITHRTRRADKPINIPGVRLANKLPASALQLMKKIYIS